MPSSFRYSSSSLASTNIDNVNIKIGLALIVGIILGSFGERHWVQRNNNSNKGPKHGRVVQLDKIPVRNTSHVDDQGRPITKQQLLEPFVIPNYVGFSVATFLPGQRMMPVHSHESLHEFFYVLEGTGIIRVNNIDHKVSPGTFLHMAPHEPHGIWIPSDSNDGPMKMAVSGVTISN